MKFSNPRIAVFTFVAFSSISMFYMLIAIYGFAGFTRNAFELNATFSNINGVQIGTPVRLAGVKVAEVHTITLDPKDYSASIRIAFLNPSLRIPKDSSLSIYSDGLVGSKYLHLHPGFSEQYLSNGQSIAKTSPGVIIEELIAQVITSFSSRD